MIAEVRVEWSPDHPITATIRGGDAASTLVVLAHGAGAGPDHPFMAGLRDRIVDRGSAVATFPYPYLAAGRRAPDRLETLVAAHRAVVAAVARPGTALILAGKSMGGRVSSYLADVGAAGFVFLGYPLLPIGASQARDTSHLHEIRAPMRFVQGERDRLAPLESITRVVDSLPLASIEVIPDADHSFRIPKRAGVTGEQMLDRLAALVAGWGRPQAGGGE